MSASRHDHHDHHLRTITTTTIRITLSVTGQPTGCWTASSPSWSTPGTSPSRSSSGPRWRPRKGIRSTARGWWFAPGWIRRTSACCCRDGTAAAEAMGYSMIGAPPLGVLENTPQVHNMVVCTLCSCYPRKLLGYPPDLYKSDAYRGRAVRDPRGLLREWNVHLEHRRRCASSTARPTTAGWCCRCDRPGPRASPKRSCWHWSIGTAWSAPGARWRRRTAHRNRLKARADAGAGDGPPQPARPGRRAPFGCRLRLERRHVRCDRRILPGRGRALRASRRFGIRGDRHGARRAAPALHAEMRACAYEALDASGAWQHGVAICLPSAQAKVQGRRQVTELGPDLDAIRPRTARAVLFDLGFGSATADLCVRTEAAAVDPGAARAPGPRSVRVGHGPARADAGTLAASRLPDQGRACRGLPADPVARRSHAAGAAYPRDAADHARRPLARGHAADPGRLGACAYLYPPRAAPLAHDRRSDRVPTSIDASSTCSRAGACRSCGR